MPAGASFTQGTVRAVPRYPSNVYYNVSRQGQQLDEYNWIYVAPADGGSCVPIAGVTTCRTAPATWDEYVTRETRVMFRHLMGNDPRPHFFHQSNLADYNPALPETRTPTRAGSCTRSSARSSIATRRPSTAPTRRSSSSRRRRSRRRWRAQDAWARGRASVSRVGPGRPRIRKNTGASAVTVPLTGHHRRASLYGGQRSGWITLAAGQQVDVRARPIRRTRPRPRSPARPRWARRCTATTGTWTGTPEITYGRQWQRCDPRCANIAGATGATYELTDADEGKTLRVAALAGNWISSVSQAVLGADGDGRGGGRSRPRPRKPTTPATQEGRRRAAPAARAAPPRRRGLAGKLKLTKLKMAPRKFAVAHKSKRRAPSSTARGSRGGSTAPRPCG